MAERNLTNLDYLSLFVGGKDGPKRQDQSTALEDVEIHMIKVLTDDTTFSVLAAVSQTAAVVNMLTANNLTAKTFAKGELVSAPGGGYITDYTASEETEYYKMMTSYRTKQVS